MTPLAAAGWFGVTAAAAAWLWWQAENVRRRDSYNRGQLRSGPRWLIADKDGRRFLAYRAAAVVWLAAGAVVLAVDSVGGFAVVVVVVAVAVFAGRRLRHNRRTLQRPQERRGVIVYAMGGFDPHTGNLRAVKFGITSRTAEARRVEVDEREQTLSVQVLAEGPGGRTREVEIHANLDPWRYPRSEWFHPAPEVLDVVRELERPTPVGQKTLRRYLA